jgi:predicted phosphodiesterase
MDFNTALILSDIHYGDLAHLEIFGKRKPASDSDLELIAKGVIDRLDKEGVSIDFLFVLGDLTSRGSPGEFADVNRFLTILRNLLNLSENKVFVTYGNHDVDWKISGIEKEAHKYHSAYCKTAANVGGLFISQQCPTYEGPVIGCGVTHLDGIDLVSLNSGIECYDDQIIKHGKLGEAQYDWLKNDLANYLREDTTKVVILHHHLLSLPYSNPHFDISALEEGANAIEHLGSLGIDLVLHGHRHHPIAHTESRTTWKKPITFFCAGSFGVDASERASGRLPNTIHTIKINKFSKDAAFEGIVETYELDSASKWVYLNEKNNEYSLNQKQWMGLADAAQKADADIQTLLDEASIFLQSENFFMLPLYNDLSLSLRCLNYNLLNESIQKKAYEMGLTITGDYPKKCIATGEQNG